MLGHSARPPTAQPSRRRRSRGSVDEQSPRRSQHERDGDQRGAGEVRAPHGSVEQRAGDGRAEHPPEGIRRLLEAQGLAALVFRGVAGDQVVPLLGDGASKILYSVDMLQVGTGSGQAAYGSSLSRLRLEAWEVRAARRLQSGERVADRETAANDALFLEGAALRLKIDDNAQVLKISTADVGEDSLEEAAECLMRAQDLDRRFRQALEGVGTTGPSERLNELTRSRMPVTYSGR